ncbi:ATP-binding protein [Pseudoduganella danionis]|uniref:histidine kinase n=1 Tax=Pseudoduganella danionis TaxID=1890295 RepID=A0ABW9SK95_9BURK|nr:ATP-binding protein [Pseudoduganella danionis]MTW32437.1 GAF domain-containing protein [Pseudoduganella danionis]
MAALLPSSEHRRILIVSDPVYAVAPLNTMLVRHGMWADSRAATDTQAAEGAAEHTALLIFDQTLDAGLCAPWQQAGILQVVHWDLQLAPDLLAEKILLHLRILSPAPVRPGLPDKDTLQINYHHMLAHSPDPVLLLHAADLAIIDSNQHARRLFGLTEAELLQTHFDALCPASQPDGEATQVRLQICQQKNASATPQRCKITMLGHQNQPLECDVALVPVTVDGHALLHTRIVDISSGRLAEELREGKTQLLEMIASGVPLSTTLDRLMLLIESQAPPVLCTIMLVADDGVTMQAVSAPSMPPDYMASIDGLLAGPSVGSCGTAIYRKQNVVVSDIMTDPLWAPYKEIPARFGLRACWATPIMATPTTVLGSFAMYYREPRSPTENDQQLIAAATQIARIAVSSTRREAELQRHREHLEVLVQERTAQLQQAKEEAEHANEELTVALENLSMTQEELVRRDKLAALGALVAGVAHELNTPIGNCLIMASSMSERTASLQAELVNGLRRSTLDNYLQQASDADAVVLRNLNRAAQLVASFKRIAVDSDNAQRERYLLADVLHLIRPVIETKLKQHGIELQEDVAAGLVLDGYPGPLGQALENLIDNCVVHAFKGRSHGTIRFRAQGGSQDEIILTIEDDGVGIPEASLSRIYDPFFTTQLGAGGSGLGLYRTHNIITGLLGGRIDVQSSPQGTRFTIHLPLVAPN